MGLAAGAAVEVASVVVGAAGALESALDAGAALTVGVGDGAEAEPLLLHPASATTGTAAKATPSIDVRVKTDEKKATCKSSHKFTVFPTG